MHSQQPKSCMPGCNLTHVPPARHNSNVHKDHHNVFDTLLHQRGTCSQADKCATSRNIGTTPIDLSPATVLCFMLYISGDTNTEQHSDATLLSR